MNTYTRIKNNGSKCVRIFVEGGKCGGFRFVDGFDREDEFCRADNEGEEFHKRTGKPWVICDADNHQIWWTDDSAVLGDLIDSQAFEAGHGELKKSPYWADGLDKWLFDVCNCEWPEPGTRRTFDCYGATIVAVTEGEIPKATVIEYE